VRHEPSLYLQLVHGTLSPLDCPIIEDTDLSSDISIGKGRLQGEADPLTWSSAMLVLYLIWTEQLFLYRNNLLVFDRLNEKLLEFGGSIDQVIFTDNVVPIKHRTCSVTR
jgi:hypothetical protein